MKQCKSYVQEMVENGVAYILSEKLIKEIQDEGIRFDLMQVKSKILAVEISSRHKRALQKQLEKKNCRNEFDKFKIEII